MNLKAGISLTLRQHQPIQQAFGYPKGAIRALFKLEFMLDQAKKAKNAVCRINSALFFINFALFRAAAIQGTITSDREWCLDIYTHPHYISHSINCQKPRRYPKRKFPEMNLKTGISLTFRQHQPIRHAFGHPKGAIRALFKLEFMPNQAKKSAKCDLQKLISTIFHKFCTF